MKTFNFNKGATLKKAIIRTAPLAILLIEMLCSGCRGAAPANKNEGESIRALSLKIFQKELEAANGKPTRRLAELAGIKRLLGFAHDAEQNDIVLFGTVAQNSTNVLWTEDLAVALKNAWLKYAGREGNTITITNPGCSIDPNPRTMRKLDEIGQQLQGTSSERERESALEQWASTCKEWQAVRVLGVPFHSRFAATTVRADYDMKRLVDGMDSLNLPGFASLTDLKLGQIRRAILTDNRIQMSLTSMNRFWFYPGESLYEEDGGIVWIKQCPVVLLTEETHLSARENDFVGAGRGDPLALRFAEDFSSFYDKIAELRPIYLDLENLFRFVTLAQILHYQSTNGTPNLESAISYLLGPFAVPHTSVAEQLEGRSGLKTFQHTNRLADGFQYYQLWLPSCGGVEIDVNLKPKSFRHRSLVLNKLKASILTAKRPANALTWDLPGNTDVVHEFLTSVSLADQNAKSAVRNTIRVENRNSKCILFTENGSILETSGASGIMGKLGQLLAFKKGSILMEVSGFRPDEFKSFRASCLKQRDEMFPAAVLYITDADQGESEIYRAVTSPGAELNMPPIGRTSERDVASRGTSSLEFSVGWKGKVQRYKVDFLNSNPALAPKIQELRRAVIERFMRTGFRSESLLDSLTSEKIELLEDWKLNDKDIKIRISTETGNVETGAVIQSSSEPLS